jgi:DNA-binding transcriptional ArsR family regulator
MLFCRVDVMPDQARRLVEVLHSHRNRRVIAVLCSAELTISELEGRLGMSQPTLSRALNELSEAGLVLAARKPEPRRGRPREVWTCLEPELAGAIAELDDLARRMLQTAGSRDAEI